MLRNRNVTLQKVPVVQEIQFIKRKANAHVT